MTQKVDYTALKRGGFIRQKQEDRFSLRLHVAGGALTADDLRGAAIVADRYGNGTVYLTARQGVEIPFVRLEDVEAVKADLEQLGLRAGAIGPCGRTVTACPGAATCPSGNIDAQDLAQKLDARYYGAEMPHKFKFGATGCMNNCLKAEENDVGIKGACAVRWLPDACISCGLCQKACRDDACHLVDGTVQVDYDACISCGRCAKACPTDTWETAPGYALFFGGQFGSQLIKGQPAVPVVKTEEQLFRITDAAVEYFRAHGTRGERFGKMLARIGREDFDAEIAKAYEG